MLASRQALVQQDIEIDRGDFASAAQCIIARQASKTTERLRSNNSIPLAHRRGDCVPLKEKNDDWCFALAVSGLNAAFVANTKRCRRGCMTSKR